MTNAQYQRERRAQRRAEGYCGICAARKPDAGFTCDVCLNRSRRLGGDQFCIECAAHGFHRVDCKAVQR